jgi:hypothetical protein
VLAGLGRFVRPVEQRQLAAQLVGEVVQRPERARGEQAVARAPGPAGIAQIPLEPFEQGGLADARLPAEHDQAPGAPPGLGRTVSQQASDGSRSSSSMPPVSVIRAACAISGGRPGDGAVRPAAVVLGCQGDERSMAR